jgi:hypothetical protein
MSVASEDFILPVKISTKFQLCGERGTYISLVDTPMMAYPVGYVFTQIFRM